ncbi:MAG TPA: hypothetical protein VFS43_01830 [Polyangiaceae bacterium]|nr:hypothetical protein [Polyangiaceae bacterium]
MTGAFTRPAWQRAAFLACAALLTLLSARLFYSALLWQTGGEWSAPLDDVFIHFDYARSAARGQPFAWTEGSGYSSGNTSLTYPFALALGHAAGFRGERLMVWAALVAAMSALGYLWAAARLFAPLPLAPTLLLPLFFVAVGALGWSVWSGMEVAFFLGLWGLALAVAAELRAGRWPRRGWAWGLGAANALVVLTRPEALTSVACLAAWAALAGRPRTRTAFALALRALAPPAAALVLQALANRWLTGEFSANGALVKLALYNPYMPADEKLDDYLFNLRYSFDRVHFHHYGEGAWAGLLPLALALFALADRRTRAGAALLLASAASWVLLVALNGQVRWQNERYLMPAVAWELAAAALGAAALVAPPRLARARLARALAGSAALAALAGEFWRHERTQYQDQVWFFARAARNIRDQHLRAGRRIGRLEPPPNRVMVGDAGAILYASDLPGFDLIGLGGYAGLPLARAGINGLPATLELLERVPPAERPEVMAIYPSWWGPLGAWFGRPLFGVPVEGNVICGGAEKVVYRTDWSLLDTGRAPLTLRPGARIYDELDLGDLLSERAHDYVASRPRAGYAVMRVLEHPRERGRQVWDGGRHTPPGKSERMVLRGLPEGRPVELLFRTAVDVETRLEIQVGDRVYPQLLAPRRGWVEFALPLDPGEVRAELPLRVTAGDGDWINYHLWAVEPAP